MSPFSVAERVASMTYTFAAFSFDDATRA